MSQNKHTPGPWIHWSGYNSVDELEAQVTAEDGDVVIASYNNLIEQGEANANLIVAAPDLLESLEAVIKVADRDTDVFNQAKAAIAKARGEQP